jgi:DNA invertase Pin-like site-specific DNA recombinase
MRKLIIFRRRLFLGEGRLYGYVRVSSKEQSEDRQLVAMRSFGIPEEDIIVEKISGKDFNRPAYRQLMTKLKRGDTLVVKSIDRFGRNYDEIIKQWRRITKDIEAMIVVIDMPLLDTRQKYSDLTGAFIADIVLQILSYVAQMERSFNHQRQAEGIAVAKAKGVRFGRPIKERPAIFDAVYSLWEQKEISARQAAKKLGVSHPTFLTWISER